MDRRVIGALVLGLASLVVAQTNPKGINVCPRWGNVKLPHETDCTKYYDCDNGKVLERQCPPTDTVGNRLHFNSTIKTCDWPWRAGCEKEETMLRTESLKGSGIRLLRAPKKCPRVNSPNKTDLIPHESDCTKYYVCNWGRKIERQCPLEDPDDDTSRLFFNPEKEVCDFPFNVNCPHGNVLGSDPEMEVKEFILETAIPTKCPRVESPNKTVHLAHERDCTKFYKCDWGRKIEMQCPLANPDNEDSRLYFNPEKQICDWRFNVNCPHDDVLGGDHEMEVKEFILETAIPTKCPRVESPNETVHLPHETDCTKFYKCDWGRKIEMECPLANENDDESRLYFDPEKQVCRWPFEVDCGDRSTPGTPGRTSPPTKPTPTKPPPTKPPPTKPPPTKPPPTDPTPTEPTSPTDPPPDKYGCLGSCSPSDPPNKITAFPHSDCRKWCRCDKVTFKFTVKTCILDYHFSRKLRKCTKPELAGCKKSEYPMRSEATNGHDETLMNILGYNDRFRW